MSKEKLYVVKNDKGYYWDFEHSGFWEQEIFGYLTTPSRKQAGLVAFEKGGNVVALIEEPEKVVLTKEQAKIVEHAHVHVMPACYISKQPDDEELLMNAYVNGYTVAKEKEYNVKVPHTKDVWYFKASKAYLLTIFPADDKKLRGKFTLTEIEHYGLQDCEKEEVTDDAD